MSQAQTKTQARAELEMRQVEQLRALRAEGKTLEDISEIMVLGLHAISRLVKKYGIPPTTRHARPGGVRRQLRHR
jgi:hypothetical protein